MMAFQLSDQALVSIHQKVMAEERLNFEDGLTLFNSPDLLGVGYLANIVRERKNGNIALEIPQSFTINSLAKLLW